MTASNKRPSLSRPRFSTGE